MTATAQPLTDLESEFGADPFAGDPGYHSEGFSDDAADFSGPADDDGFEDRDDTVPFSQKTPGERARYLMGNKEKYRDSPAQRTGSLVWASLEQAAAIDRQTAAIERQTEILARQAELTAALFAEQRRANQLTFFAMSPEDFDPKRGPERTDGREHPHTQMKRQLGILPPLPAAAEQ